MAYLYLISAGNTVENYNGAGIYAALKNISLDFLVESSDYFSEIFKLFQLSYVFFLFRVILRIVVKNSSLQITRIPN